MRLASVDPVSGRRDWMRRLGQHYAEFQRAYPDDRLLIVFDVDGVVVDPRHALRHRLLEYDRVHDTDHFDGLDAADVTVGRNHVEGFLAERGLPAVVRRKILDWYLDGRSEPGPTDLRPSPGVLGVIRWFQLQRSTYVGLTTERPERLRDETLRSLNMLGRDLRVEFDADLLHMSASGGKDEVIASKLEGLKAFARAGFRTCAVVDDEPAAIRALAEADESGEILFLHARVPSDPERVVAPRTVGGHHFDIAGLVGEDDLPDEVQLVWHGVNDEVNLRQFLSSRVRWGECDVRRDPRCRLVLRHDSFEETPWSRDERPVTLARALAAIAEHGRGIKLDLKDGRGSLDEVMVLLDRHEIGEDDLWFNARIDVLGAAGFRTLRCRYPDAIVQCPVDFLAPLVRAEPTSAEATLRMLAGWGISRFSVAWGSEHTRPLLERLEDWGYEVNLYAVPDHDAFLQAVLLLPDSLTADFNFPDWNYYGRGSGERRRYHDYRVRDAAGPEAAAVAER
jgi:beta-phosphoglucomutase-like phosphatase (HAD superfamily)